jgi:membrane protein YdbS with pleckstrin-like domain
MMKKLIAWALLLVISVGAGVIAHYSNHLYQAVLFLLVAAAIQFFVTISIIRTRFLSNGSTS